MRGARATALLAIGSGLAAAVFDAEPLWVPAATLALLAAGSAAWIGLGARAVRVTRTLGARRVVEDEPLTIRLDVSAGGLGLPPSALADPLLPAPIALPTGRRGASVQIEARFESRGRRVLALPRLLIADPLGLATREVSARASAGEDELLVLPRIEPVIAAPGGGRGERSVRRGRVAVGQTELDGIRALRDGTPASRIFWPAVARGAEPQERSLTATSESRPLVVLDPRNAAAEHELDAAVRATASLARALARSGGCSVLLPGDRRPTELEQTHAGWAQLHARLALIGSAAGPSLAALAGRRGPVVFVSARMRARMPQALGPAHGAQRVLVLPGMLPERRAAFAVAGCNGYVLSGSPAGLGRATRSAPRSPA